MSKKLEKLTGIIKNTNRNIIIFILMFLKQINKIALIFCNVLIRYWGMFRIRSIFAMQKLYKNVKKMIGKIFSFIKILKQFKFSDCLNLVSFFMKRINNCKDLFIKLFHSIAVAFRGYKKIRSAKNYKLGKNNFCTICSVEYLFKVLALYFSLEKYADNFTLYICCIDKKIYTILNTLQLAQCVPVSLSEIKNRELGVIKANRSVSEFSWTLKSVFMVHLFESYKLPSVLYCDSDVCFFASPNHIYKDWGNASVYLCSQRDIDWVEDKYGKYQAGIIGFRNDDMGRKALSWWKTECMEWCYAYEDKENNRWGDQKYLDEITLLFSNVKISTHKGINAAPWNTVYNNNYEVLNINNSIFIEKYPLVVFHFALIDVYSDKKFDLWNLSKIVINSGVKTNIYIPYLESLQYSIGVARNILGKQIRELYSSKKFEEASTPFIYSESNLVLSKWDYVYTFCTISSTAFIPKTIALYKSIEKKLDNFHLWICCMDNYAYEVLNSFGLQNATLIKVENIETTAIKRTKKTRELNEYCWTLKSVLCNYLFSKFNIDRLLYVDSDLYFFSHPRPIHEAWRGHSTLINKQMGRDQLEKDHGIYQAGLIGFSKDKESLDALNWWQKKCIEWCYDNHDDNDRWGDQKYLQQFPLKFSSIKINDNVGIIAAPWNIIMNHKKEHLIAKEKKCIFIGSEELICYHFGSIDIYSAHEYDMWKHEMLDIDDSVIKYLYKPYLKNIQSIIAQIALKGFDTSKIFIKKGPNRKANSISISL